MIRELTKTQASYLFLDFDGVLNTEAWQRHCREAGLPAEDGFGPVFDPEAVGHLGAILTAVPRTRVVITSSWKWEGMDKMRRLWMNRNLPGALVGITTDPVAALDEEALERINRGELPVGRGAEIRAWLEAHGETGAPYLILDDMPDFYPDQLPHFIETDPRVGITLEDAARAVRILKGDLSDSPS